MKAQQKVKRVEKEGDIWTSFEHSTGTICGATCLKNLSNHYCDWSDYKKEVPNFNGMTEELVMGLGSSPFFFMGKTKDDKVVLPPNAVFICLTSETMETDWARNLDIDYYDSMENDHEKADRVLQENVSQGNPQMLLIDVFYLDYGRFATTEFHRHYPHRAICAGMNLKSEKYYLYETDRNEHYECSFEALRQARRGPIFIPYCPNTVNNIRRGTKPARSLYAAVLNSFAHGSARMLGKPALVPSLLRKDDFVWRIHFEAFNLERRDGIEGLRYLKHLLGLMFQEWKLLADYYETGTSKVGLADLKKITIKLHTLLKMTYGSIERFGTGGSAFRIIYKRYLQQVSNFFPKLIAPEVFEILDRAIVSWRQTAECAHQIYSETFHLTVTNLALTPDQLKEKKNEILAAKQKSCQAFDDIQSRLDDVIRHETHFWDTLYQLAKELLPTVSRL